jgi:uncharacterized membrane protein YecN with MAPEG domain
MTPDEQKQEQLSQTKARGQAYEEARKRLQARRDFGANLVAYVVVNASFIAVWAMTGGGYFWPAWVIAAWGVGLVLHAWEVFVRRPITEADVEREMHRTGPHG